MSLAGRVAALLGVPAEDTYGVLLVDLPREGWAEAVTALRDDPELRLDVFDVLMAVDESPGGFAVVLRLWSRRLRAGLLLRTRCPRDEPAVPSLAGVFAGVDWHERTAAEMFGLDFPGHPGLVPLLLPRGFQGHPLRKDTGLVSRAVKPWPGAVEPGQSAADPGAGRRRTPPGVPRPGSRP